MTKLRSRSTLAWVGATVAAGALVGCSATGSSDSADAVPQRPAETKVEPSVAVEAQPAPSQVDAQRPTALTLPSGTTVHIDASATGADGELEIPSDVNRAGWWDGSSRLGDPFGGIVIAAHVDSFDQGLGRFAELLSVRRGDVVEVSAGGMTQRFRIASAELVPKASVDADSEVFSVQGPSRLVLITCGGAYDPTDGGYQDNLVVIARPLGG